MSLRFKPQYAKRFNYEPDGSESWKLPSGNLYSAMNFLNKLMVNIASGGASNAPDFQQFKSIESIELIRDTDTIVWSMSGQAFQLMFGKQYGTGIAAVDNLAVAGSAASNIPGQQYISVKAYPLGAKNPQDFAIDTRAHDYELKIKWANLTDTGVLFGTHTGAITSVASQNYLEVELEIMVPEVNAATGKMDRLKSVAPLIVGLKEEKLSIDANNTEYQLDIPTGKRFYNMVLYTTHMANTDQEVGENDIIRNKARLVNTQGDVFQNVLVDMMRQKTAIEWGHGSNINAGIYDLKQTLFGSVNDVLVSNSVNDLILQLDVVKQSNVTYLRPIYITQEGQGK